MDKSINDLFRLVQEYKPQAVGIEISGQQNAFIKWIQGEMMNRNVWFSFASSSKSGEPGIRPLTDKLARFNVVVPWFKMRKMFFPEEMKSSVIMGVFMGQLRLVTNSGIKGKDDAIDTISQLGYLTPWKPSESAPVTKEDDMLWDEHGTQEPTSGLSLYIV